MLTEPTYTAFAGDDRVSTGPLRTVLLESKARLEAGERKPILFFEDDTGREVDFDFRGTPEEVVARAMPDVGPGRPKLGVISREVTLLPRHWEWLEAQPNGMSAALRRIVEGAMKNDLGETEARRVIAATGRLMTAIAGDRPGYEEATRALYARDRKRFESIIRAWPAPIRQHLRERVKGALHGASKAKSTKR